MESFSLHEDTLRKARELGIGLEELGDATLAGHEGSRTPAHFRARVASLARWCRICEQIIVERNLSSARVLAGFQRLSRLTPIQKRYAALARVARQVVVFGEPDALSGGLASVSLAPGDPLAQEWFLVVESEGFQALLTARALDRFGDAPIGKRRFEGITSHATDLVRFAAQKLSPLLPRA